MNKKDNLKQYLGIIFGELFTGSAVLISITYISYCYTDIGHCSPEMMSTGMLIASVIGIVWSLFSGAIVQNTKTKQGQYRPWFFWGTIAICLFNFLCLFNLGSAALNCVIITIGYLIVNCIMDSWAVAKYGIYEKMSQGDSELRTTYSGISWLGGNISFIIYGAVFLPLVNLLGGSNISKGFLYTNCILTVISAIGAGIIVKIGKPFDTDNTKDNTAKETIDLKTMFRSVIKNRLLLTVSIGGIIKVTGACIFMYILIYQCTSVLEDMMAYSVAMVIYSAAGTIGSMIASSIIKLCGGRKKGAIITLLIASAGYVAMAFFGKSYIGFMITLAIAYTFQSVYDSIDMMMYLDASEVMYNKTGEDTRAFGMGISALAAKIGTAFSSVGLGAVLVAVNYTEGAILDAAGKTTLTMATGLIPAVTMALYALILIIFHNVSDKEIEKCIEENAAKDAAFMSDN